MPVVYVFGICEQASLSENVMSQILPKQSRYVILNIIKHFTLLFINLDHTTQKENNAKSIYTAKIGY